MISARAPLRLPDLGFETVAAKEAIAISAGVAFTLALFLGLAFFEAAPSPPPEATIGELKAAAPPAEPAPPKPVEEVTAPAAATMPVAGIESGPSDSVIKIAPTPPELAALIGVSDVPPAATVDIRKLYTELRPTIAVASNFDRIYTRSEVDQPPRVLSRDDPVIPSGVRRDAAAMHATLLITVDLRGQVASARVLKPSGNPEFDRILLESVRTSWVFSPAIKSGKHVRCFVEQLITVRWSAGSRFSTE